MNTQSYFKSLSEELRSLKDRVRNFIEVDHWLTDGEWKESVIRYFLKRNLPGTTKVGRGFIIEGSRKSYQIDILIYDDSKPVLFKDGDLVFVTPDVVNGIIEVKSRVTPHKYKEAIERLCHNAEIMRSRSRHKQFAALFSFDKGSGRKQKYLDILAEVTDNQRKLIDFIAVGDSHFIKYWEFNPQNSKRLYESWHSYHLDGIAPGYFLHNVVDSISPDSVFQNNEIWFPLEGKESHNDGTKVASWHKEDG